MDFLERVLDERADDLARVLEEQAGLSAPDAKRFLHAAGRALIASYEWNRSSRRPIDLHDEDAAGDLLAVIHGRALAAQLRLTPAHTWAGLRAIVPMIVHASASESPDAPAHARPRRRVRITAEEAAGLDLGLAMAERQRRSGPTIAE